MWRSAPFYGFPNSEHSYTIFDMNTIDLFLTNTLFKLIIPELISVVYKSPTDL